MKTVKQIAKIDAERRLAAASTAQAARERRLAVRESLKLLRLRYGALFSGWADLSDINLAQSKKALLDQVVARQASRLTTLSDQRLCAIWILFAHYYSRIRDAERSRRDRMFQQALVEEWSRRSLRGDSAGGAFRWPSTAALPGEDELDADLGPRRGLLSALTYRVGISGLPEDIRRRILDYVFADTLPPVHSQAYMLGWGEPGTPARLQKLAECIAAFTRNAKRQGRRSFAEAIRHWEGDLLYLHDRYYRDHFGFGWPATDS